MLKFRRPAIQNVANPYYQGYCGISNFETEYDRMYIKNRAAPGVIHINLPAERGRIFRAENVQYKQVEGKDAGGIQVQYPW